MVAKEQAQQQEIEQLRSDLVAEREKYGNAVNILVLF